MTMRLKPRLVSGAKSESRSLAARRRGPLFPVNFKEENELPGSAGVWSKSAEPSSVSDEEFSTLHWVRCRRCADLARKEKLSVWK